MLIFPSRLVFCYCRIRGYAAFGFMTEIISLNDQELE